MSSLYEIIIQQLNREFRKLININTQTYSSNYEIFFQVLHLSNVEM
jgi:hypothetical protein